MADGSGGFDQRPQQPKRRILRTQNTGSFDSEIVPSSLVDIRLPPRRRRPPKRGLVRPRIFGSSISKIFTSFLRTQNTGSSDSEIVPSSPVDIPQQPLRHFLCKSGDIFDSESVFPSLVDFLVDIPQQPQRRILRTQSGGSSDSESVPPSLVDIPQQPQRRIPRTQSGVIFDSESVPPSLVDSIGPILRVANEVESRNPRVAYLCRFYAFEKALRLDPRYSELGSVLLQRLQREEETTLAGRVKNDHLEMLRFYRDYYEKDIQALHNAADNADRAQLTKAYQTATVIFEVWEALHQTEAVEVDEEATLVEWIFLLVALCMEMFSIACDQASSLSKPGYALAGMLLAYAGLLTSISELIYKGRKERVQWRRWWFYYPLPGYRSFGTVPEIYGLLGGISQCICSTVQYVYFIRHAENPIKVSLWPAILLLCLGAARLKKNRNKTGDQHED